jgi:deoxyribodipyrimidine photolyase-related protein
MPKSLTLVLADQLFIDHFTLQDDGDVVMVESLTESKRLNYHKLRLTYLFTCMRHFRDFLLSKGKNVYYFELTKGVEFETVIKKLKQDFGYTKLKIYTPNNKFFDKKLQLIVSNLEMEYEGVENPMFLTSKSDFRGYLSTTGSKSQLRMADFYIWQRKRLNVLLDRYQKPLGGSWSHDKYNRKKLPKYVEFKQDLDYYKSEYFDKVRTQVQNLFANNPGKVDNIWLPVTHEQAHKKLQYFLENILLDFGDFEDAMTSHNDFVFHSVLSPMLNVGLLTPRQVLDSLASYLSQNPSILITKINSIEGFIRQIIGWREWVKGMYDNKYDESFLELNFFRATNPLPDYFYRPSLYLKELEQNTPLKTVLLKVEKLGWCHHIERLMILANWMTLNEYDPAECYNWFASQFVDAAEWVMVPNVMGMGTFSDGGIYATKPYISGGNYIKKMSDYPHSSTWEKLWTDKFWSFIEKHRVFFQTQPRLSMLLNKTKNASQKFI